MNEEQILSLIIGDDVSDIEGISDDEDALQIEDVYYDTVRDCEDDVLYEDLGVEDVKIYNDEYIVNNKLTRRDKIRWKKGKYEYIGHYMPIEWYKKELSNAVHLSSPVEYFLKYFTDNIMSKFVEFTNLYAVQKNVGRWTPTNIEEIKTLIAILLTMGNLKFPRIKKYWSPETVIPLIANNMTVNRFYKLRNALHIVDITARPEGNTDRFWKVRPLYDAIQKRCHQLQLESILCIDEQMVPFRGSLDVRQYIKGKPNPWGIKIFALAGKSGLIYDFIIYQGQRTELNEEHKQFGQGAAVVMKLIDSRVNIKNVKLLFDNYFSTFNLFEWLYERNIYAIGTIRANRFKNPPLESDKELKKKPRGSTDTAISQDGRVILTKWFDNKGVLFGSNYCGVGNQSTCRRWDRCSRNYINVPCPEVVNTYNNGMGGVDKMDFLLSTYRSHIHLRKWTVCMISHALDLAVANSWLQYKEDANNIGIQKNKIIDLYTFRDTIATSLLAKPRSRGRPSHTDPGPSTSYTAPTVRPPTDLHYDNYGHFPEFDDRSHSSRCKYEKCKKKTKFFCTKCKTALCIVKDRNCFIEYHTK